jgi:hypothetical protein
MPEYFIHNNFDRPYKVVIGVNKTVKIYKKKSFDLYEDKEFKIYKPIKIFIGKIKNRNKKYDGNTILLQITKNSYTYIGNKIYTFTTNSQIIEYESPIGNNDVPYPYAIDSNGFYYLMIENVKIKIPMNYDDCYRYYYQARLITSDIAFNTKPIFYSGIIEFRINNEPYTLTWVIDAVKDYKRIQKYFSKNMSVKMINGNIIKLTEKKYKEIMDEFNEKLQAIKF